MGGVGLTGGLRSTGARLGIPRRRAGLIFMRHRRSWSPSIVPSPLDRSRPAIAHDRLGPVERLDLGFLVDTEDERLVSTLGPTSASKRAPRDRRPATETSIRPHIMTPEVGGLHHATNDAPRRARRRPSPPGACYHPGSTTSTATVRPGFDARLRQKGFSVENIRQARRLSCSRQRPKKSELTDALWLQVAAARARGLPAAVICPIGFVLRSDGSAVRPGRRGRSGLPQRRLPMARAATVNDDPLFLEMIADEVVKTWDRYRTGRPSVLSAINAPRS